MIELDAAKIFLVLGKKTFRNSRRNFEKTKICLYVIYAGIEPAAARHPKCGIFIVAEAINVSGEA